MFSFDKSKKSALSSNTESAAPQEHSEVSSPSVELVNSVSPVRVRKDTFISQGARLSGKVGCDANMVVEGQIDGDVHCDGSVKIEHGGMVAGEIRAQLVMINGVVQGQVHATAITIMAQGKVVGDIFADELSIEKGGIFTGMSNPLQPNGQPQEKRVQPEVKRDKIVKPRIEQSNVVPLAENTAVE